MSKNYAGIDLSMACPAITVGPSKDFSKCNSFFYSANKKLEGRHSSNIFGFLHWPYSSDEERYDIISDWVMAILLKYDVKFACLEGYSMGSSAGRLFNIAENGGLLKHKMWKAGIEFIIPAPTAVKKYFNGKGNAKKEQMHESFVERTSVSISDILNITSDKSPVSDIVDSYAMLCYGFDNR